MAGDSGEDRAPREVKDHLLFEIATEVAHRGTCRAEPCVS